jgi:hypothetical protein
LRSATTGNWPTKVSDTSENVTIVTRQRRTRSSRRATANPAISRRTPRSPSGLGTGGGRVTVISEATTNR